MNLDDIRKVLELVREHELAEFELEQDGLKLRVRKAGAEVAFVAPAQVAPVAALPGAVAPAPAAANGASPAAPVPVSEDTPLDLAMIKSPIVGTFYRAPEPGAPNFVEVGTRVRKGQVLCIIEAMKLMNEIECDTDGEIAAAYVENGKPVQFGDRLFAVKVG
jgi:acetyl-CoA carboxylase biotin carboxyl carrier protein